MWYLSYKSILFTTWSSSDQNLYNNTKFRKQNIIKNTSKIVFIPSPQNPPAPCELICSGYVYGESGGRKATNLLFPLTLNPPADSVIDILRARCFRVFFFIAEVVMGSLGMCFISMAATSRSSDAERAVKCSSMPAHTFLSMNDLIMPQGDFLYLISQRTVSRLSFSFTYKQRHHLALGTFIINTEISKINFWY